jgi:phenylpyruvate tautomerase PptA (4-oxalocrotonate tautomerase family)
MPMVDAYIPEGALSPSAERDLLAKITTGYSRTRESTPATRGPDRSPGSSSTARVYVAGAPPKSPRYRFICQVPEGQYDDERRAAVTAAMTQAVAEAEGGAWPHIPARGQ